MSGEFQAGDLVECIDKTPCNEATKPYVDRLAMGELYTVLSTAVAPSGSPVLIIDKAQHHPLTFGWYAWRFRKVYRPRADAFSELLKTPTNAPTKEPVAA